MTTTTQQDPNGLLNAVIARHQLKNDAALARLLQVQTPVISKLRHHRLLAGDSMVLRCVERAGMALDEVRQFVPSPYVVAA